MNRKYIEYYPKSSVCGVRIERSDTTWIYEEIDEIGRAVFRRETPINSWAGDNFAARLERRGIDPVTLQCSVAARVRLVNGEA